MRERCTIERSLTLAGLMVAVPAALQAQTVLPQGGSVVSGQARIAAPSTNALSITQNSSKAIVDWNSFSVGPSGSVSFVQPNASSAILNRVTGSTSSSIAGAITGNGQVFLVNPNGIAITPTGTVQVGGGFVASTLNIGNADFNAGNFNFAGNGASAGVSNAGTISSSPGGFVGLIGGTVSNSGTISVPLGKVGLGSGERATLDPTGDGFLQVAVPTGAVAADGRALVDVSGRIRASGSSIAISAATAQQAVRDAVNVTGALSARSMSGRNGNIVLDGGAGGNVVVSGKLSATGGKHHAGGTIVVTGRTVGLTSSANLDASGTTGGNILVGGDLHGGFNPSVKLVQGAVANAQTTMVDQGAVINANGTAGAGGNAVIWSDVATDFRGTITATGSGTASGGAVEVSSHGVLGFRGSVDVTATSGKTGTLLLDPYDVTISSGSDISISDSINTFTPTGTSSILSVGTLQNALASANVTVSTGSSGSQNGDITVANAVSWSSSNSLSLNAAGAIAINAPVTAPSGSLTLSAGSLASSITVAGAINVGSLTVSQGAWSQNIANLPALFAGQFSVGTNASFLRAAGGSGTAGSPYLLTDIYGIQGIGSSASYLTNSYKLLNDIDASTSSAWNSGLGFNPIGSNTLPGYTGTFDGNNFAIANLFINRGSTGTGVGMFGYTSGATIQNLYLLNANVTGGSGGSGGFGSGTLVGVADNSSLIQNVSVTGTMTGSSAAGAHTNIGGIVGELNHNSTLQNSSAAVNVTSALDADGGAVGAVDNGSLVQSVSATGNVSAPGRMNVAGLAGYVGGTIVNSYATGAVTAGSVVGGLIGTNAGAVSNSYATGSVSGGNGFAGGSGSGTFSNDYWNTQTSGQGAGGAGGATGLTTAQMQSQASFAGFDFAGTWYQTAGYYPTLRGTTTILGAAPGSTSGNLTVSTAADTVLTSATNTTNINTTSLQNLLGAGNVLVSTTSGTLAVNDNVSWGSSLLRLASSGVLTIAANITSGGGNLGITSSAAATVNGVTIDTGGGNLSALASTPDSANGISLINATINVGSGTGTLTGQSTNGLGVSISGASALTASSGSITLSGLAATSTVASGSGMVLHSNSALTTAGAITLNGTGGTTDKGHGITMESGATVTSTGSLTMNGVAQSGNYNGINFNNNTVTANSGNVTINGTSDASGAGLGLGGGTLSLANNGAGQFSLIGVSSSGSGFGLNAGTSITTSGAVSLSGQSTSANGIYFAGSNTLTDNAGNLAIGGTSNSGYGLVFQTGGNALTNRGAGSFAISGDSQSSDGVNLNTNVDVAFAGGVSVSGTSANGSGVGFDAGSSLTASNGNLGVTGTSTSGAGIAMAAASLTNSGAGTLSLTGTSGSGNGTQFDSGASLTTSGAMTLTGISTSGYGLSFTGSNAITASGGNLALSGGSSSSLGMELRGTSTITNNGSGTLVVNAMGGADLAASISSLNGALELSGSGSINQSGGTVAASSLLLSGASGNFALNAAGNQIGTVAVRAARVVVTDDSTLTVGSVLGTTGVVTTGNLFLVTTGDLTIAAGATVSGSSPVLVAAGAFTNHAGSGAVSAASGRWLVYSNSPAIDTFGGLNSGNSAVWDTTYPSLPSVNFDRYVFAYQPVLTVTSTSASKTYGTDASGAIAANDTISGVQTGVANAYLGDSAAAAYSGAATVTSSGAAPTANVAGSPYAIDVALGTLTSPSNYSFGFQNSGQLTVTPAPLAITSSNQSKTYGTNFALGTTAFTTSGLANSDTVTHVTLASAGSGATATVAGGPYGITPSAAAGSGLSNYNIRYDSSGLLTVNPAPVSVTALGGSSSYGSSPANPGLSATGLQNGENANVLTGLRNSFGISGTSAAGSYIMAVTGSLTDPNYTVVSTNTGSWTVNAVGVTPLRGPVTDGSPRYIPAPSGRPSELDSGALSGLGNWSAAVNIGLANSIAAGPVAAARLPARDAGTPTVSPSPMPSRSPMPISIPPSLDMPLAIPPPEPLPVLAATTPPVANTDCPDNSRSQVPNCDVASPPKQVPAPIGFMASPPDHDALLADMNRKPEGLAGFTIVPRVVVTAAAATAGLTIVTGLMLKLLGDSTAINGLLSVMLVWRLFKRLIAMIRRKWRGNKDRPPSVPPSDANRAPEAAGASKISGGHNVIASAVF